MVKVFFFAVIQLTVEVNEKFIEPIANIFFNLLPIYIK